MQEEKIGSDVRLLRAAQEELIDNEGQLEMLAVAKRAGLSTGLAYRYFGSKTGLVAAVVDSFYQPIREIALGEAIPLNLEWAERERHRLKALIDYYYDHPLAELMAGRLAREPQVLDVEHAHMDALLKAGERNIAQGQKHGTVDPDLNPRITVALLMGGLNQALHSAITAKKRPAKAVLLRNIWRFIESALLLQSTQPQKQRKV